MINSDILAEAAVWAALALLASNFRYLISRFPSFFLEVQSTGIAMPPLYGRVLIAVLACWEILLNASTGGNLLPAGCFFAITGYLLYIGWQADAEAHLRWLGLYAATCAGVLCWQSIIV